MELLINHISQLRLDRRDAGNYDILSLISVIMDSAFAVLRFGCLLRRNVMGICGVACVAPAARHDIYTVLSAFNFLIK